MHLYLSSAIIFDSFKNFVLGFIQGITEFVPISSTAHLSVLPILFGGEDPGIQTIASIQLGSIFAVLIYFFNDLKDLLNGVSSALFKGNYTNSKSLLAFNILVANLPILIIGISIKLFWNEYESSFLRQVPSIAFVSILMAILLFLGERYGVRNRSIKALTVRDSFLIGLSQVLALIPGSSRSGVTITAALLLGLNRESSARFSFLVGIPAITFAGLIEFQESLISSSFSDIFPLIIGICSAAFFSYISIDFLMKYLRNNTLLPFVYYRIVFGTVLLILYY